MANRRGRVTMDDLRLALRNEHGTSCGNACDIDAAQRAGCYLWAAHLLTGATDEGIDETERIYAKLSPSGHRSRRLEAERKRLLRVPHSECECGAIVWDSVGSRCGNCGGVTF